jgi:hypothetical protein
MSQPAGCTPPRPENRPGDAGEPGTPLGGEFMNIFGMTLGFFLLVFGVIIIKFGDRQVGNVERKGGIVLKVFSQSPLNAKILKWVVGLLTIWFGIGLVLTRGHL